MVVLLSRRIIARAALGFERIGRRFGEKCLFAAGDRGETLS
jgi:hypothetical protein